MREPTKEEIERTLGVKAGDTLQVESVGMVANFRYAMKFTNGLIVCGPAIKKYKEAT